MDMLKVTMMALPREQEDFIAALRTRGSLLADSGTTGWVPMDIYSLNMRISEAEALGIVKPGMRVLDLGAGCATSTLIWALRGYRTVGIELNTGLAELGQKAIEEAVAKRFIQPGMAEIFIGSYYPLAYIQRRNAGQTLALACEHIVRSTHYHPIAESPDTYEKYGIDIKSFGEPPRLLFFLFPHHH
jgi:hypothetical protein